MQIEKDILIKKLLERYQHQLKPVLPFPAQEKIIRMDFTEENEELRKTDLKDTPAFDAYVQKVLRQQGALAGAGGYGENRVIYRRSNHFGGEESRSVHLGIDVWMEAYTPVYSPLDGEIHSFGDNAGFGNYGPTLILVHQLDQITFYSLYGHLSKESLTLYAPGKRVKAGEQIGDIGDYPENGDWPPHLHFQLMTDMLGNEGDFPGVAKPSEKEAFLSICPDPNLILNIEVLKAV